MSSPHFYQADEKFVQDVFGMRPKKEDHQTAIDINPVRFNFYFTEHNDLLLFFTFWLHAFLGRISLL